MPLTEKGEKNLSSMKKHYGKKKGLRVFYASANKGTITGVEGKKKKHDKIYEPTTITGTRG